MSFKDFNTKKDAQTAMDNFSKGLLYCLYRVAEELGYADTRIAATDTQKKVVIMDMLSSGVIPEPDFWSDFTGESFTFEDFSYYVYKRCEEMTDDNGLGNPRHNIGIRYGRRTEAITVTLPEYKGETGVPDPEQFYAFAYMPVRGFDRTKKDPHNYHSVPVYKKLKVSEGKSVSNRKEYGLNAIKRGEYVYFSGSLINVFSELGRAGQIIKNDSREFQELSSAVDVFIEGLRQLENRGEYSIAKLKDLLNWPVYNGKSLMSYVNAYTEAKGRESGDLSSKQVSRLNACGRIQELYKKVQDIAWQEENYYPADDEIVELSRKIEKRKETLRSRNIDLKKLNKKSKTVSGEELEQTKTEIAETEEMIGKSEDELKGLEAALTQKQAELERLQRKNPDHRMRYGFLNSDKYKDAIAGKLLTARLQQMDPAVVKKALTDKAAYADLFAKVKESPEFRNNTLLMTNSDLRKLSEKSPSDIMKSFAPKKIGPTLNDDAFISHLQDANIDINVQAEKSELFSITGFLLKRSTSLLAELKAADSTFHSSSHKKFEASLENLHKKILDMGVKPLKNLSFDDLKDAMSDVAFAAQTYQYLHQGKTLADGKLNQNIIDRMAVASEIGIINDFISSPDSSAKTYKGLMTELNAFQSAKATMNTWISAGEAEKANTFAADLTDYKIFKAKEVSAVKDHPGFKDRIEGKNGRGLEDLFNDKQLAYPSLDLKKQAVKAPGLV